MIWQKHNVVVFILKYFTKTLNTIRSALFTLACRFPVALLADQVIFIRPPRGRHPRFGRQVILLAHTHAGSSHFDRRGRWGKARDHPHAAPPSYFLCLRSCSSFCCCWGCCCNCCSGCCCSCCWCRVCSLCSCSYFNICCWSCCWDGCCCFSCSCCCCWGPATRFGAMLACLRPGERPLPLTISPLRIGQSLAPPTPEGLAARQMHAWRCLPIRDGGWQLTWEMEALTTNVCLEGQFVLAASSHALLIMR